MFKWAMPGPGGSAMVKAARQVDDPAVIAEASRGLGEAMVGIRRDRSPRATPVG